MTPVGRTHFVLPSGVSSALYFNQRMRGLTLSRPDCLRFLGPSLLMGWALCVQVSGQTPEVLPSAGDLNAQFQSALTQYHTGDFAKAAAQLEMLLPRAPQSYELHELLGLAYAEESQNQKAVDQLSIAVDLKPESATARTNLATGLMRAGKLGEAEAQFKKALVIEPRNYSANHNLAEFYLQAKRLPEALPQLEAAQRINPAAYDNGYDLAEAYFLGGRLDEAETLVKQLLKQKDTGELHNLAAQISEKKGNFLNAAKEFEVAAHMDPSEENLFAWGSEFLLHRTYQPAIEVFQKGIQRYPDAPRLYMGLGMSLYSRGLYDESIKALLTAADLNPADARCYLFLSKAYLSAPNQAEDVIGRFKTYAEMQPGNALALYYYAMSLWKGRRTEATPVDFAGVEALLQKSIALDSSIADAHLQLGILYATQHEYPKAYPEYIRALQLDSNLPDVHFRLGQYYVRVGEKDHADQEFDTYKKLHAQHLADVDKERAEVQQFVYAAQSTPSRQP
jgi:tetratricopeptide (TPR) repeat protein